MTTTIAFYFETDSNETGWIDASSIEEARAIFRAEHPGISPESAGVWGPSDAEYPRTSADAIA